MIHPTNSELIAGARVYYANNSGSSLAGPGIIQRLATALESLTATLTETEADLQTSRERAEALQAKITAALVFADEAGEIDHEESNFAAGANAVAAILESAPSPTPEAVKVDTTTEEVRVWYSYGVNSGRTIGFCVEDVVQQVERQTMGPVDVDKVERRTVITTEWVPVSTEGEGRG